LLLSLSASAYSGPRPTPSTHRALHGITPSRPKRSWPQWTRTHEALLIRDQVIQSDQGRKYVYVVDTQNNRVQTRSIKTGSLQEDGFRVVDGEIKQDDWVVVGAIQQVHPQMEVKPDFRPTPSLAGQSEAAPQAAGRAKPGPSATGKPKD
jgi:hypothetical protein